MTFQFLLLQSVASQRVFGGAERVVAWREASGGSSMIVYFAGSDLAALTETFMSSVVLFAVSWPFQQLEVDAHTRLWVFCALNYTTWGRNYIWSIYCDPNTAQMISVVMSFTCFLLSGVNPPFSTFTEVPAGIYAMAPSPIRWTYGYLTLPHMQACSP